MKSAIFKSLFLSLVLIGHVEIGYAQTASILPPAKTTFLDNNGKPLVGGKVDFYIPGTTTRKTTWQDGGETIANTNPVILDSAGRGLILGDGSYRQIVKDKNGNLIWDQVTSSTGSSGGGGSTPTVGDGDAVGMVKAWSGMIAPYGYVFAYGQEFVRASYPEVFAVLTSQQNVSCTSGSPTLTGVTSTLQLPIGAAIESACLNSGATIISKTTSTVTASSNAIISTTTTARFFPFGNGDGNLTFNIPDLRGRVIAGNDIMGGIAANRLTSTYFASPGLNATGGNQSTLIPLPALPQVSLTLNGTPATISVTSGTLNVLNTGNSSSYQGGSNSFLYSTSQGVLTSTGSYTPAGTTNLNGNVTQQQLGIVQPTSTYNYIIKVIPDSNPNSFFGVASIGGMTGVITCGFGITCAGNTISAVNSTLPTPTSTTLGGVFTITCSSSNWINTLDATGTFGCSQPNFSDLLGTTSVAQGGTGANTFTANSPLIGNGTSAITQGTRTGNTTKFATSTGSLINGNCVKIDASGNLVDAGTICAGGSGNVPQIPIENFSGGCGVSDNTGPLNNLVASVSGGPVVALFEQPCTYTFTQANALVFTKNVQIKGGGQGVTQLKYSPTADGIFLKWLAPVAPTPVFGGGISDITLFSNDLTHTKTMIQEFAFSGFKVENVNCGWDTITQSTTGAQVITGGTGSRCFSPHGWDFGYVHHVWFAADIPIEISMNPYWSYAQDQWHYQDLYLQGTANVGLFPSIIVDNGVTFSNTTFDGYQSWVNGSFGFAYQDVAWVNAVYGIVNGGTGYNVGDNITLTPGAGGTCSAAPHLTVLAVSGGVITAASVTPSNTGTCTAQPTGDLWTQASVSPAGGSGGQFHVYHVGGYNLKFANVRSEQGGGVPSNYYTFDIEPNVKLINVVIDNALMDGLRSGVAFSNVWGGTVRASGSIGGSSVPVFLVVANSAAGNRQICLYNNTWLGTTNYSSSFTGLTASLTVTSASGSSTVSSGCYN